MTPSATRVAILIAELMVFFMVTAFAVHFISYAGALQMSPGDKPPAVFPVILYEGDRAKPDPKRYRVVPWSEWQKLAEKQPNATLLLPEGTGKLKIGDNGSAAFTAIPEGEARQAVELHWVADGSEQQVRYSTDGRALSPRYYRAITTNTLFLGGAIGFVAGLFVGRTMRRRWLAQPGHFVPKT